MKEEAQEKKTGLRRSLKNYVHSLLDMRSDMLSYGELQAMMEENTVIRGANMWILMLAILIASIGLNVNSTAVIIGAMLISPLMSGILTMGYSLAIRDLSMLKHAAARFGTQVVISLVTSTVYFTLSPLTVATSEMIARTSPTLWDVLIALFGGIAGSIGNTRRKASNVIPGVAIATALMPPLCTVGYGLATWQLSFVLGAFYLFAINTLFIALSAFLVTKLLGVPARQMLDRKKEKRIKRIITVIVIIAVIPSILFGAITVYKSILEKNVTDYLGEEFVFADTQLVQSSVDQLEKRISVSLVGMQLSDEQIRALEDKLENYGLEGFSLHVTQNKSLEGETDSDKVTIAVQENTIRDLQTQLEAATAQAEALEAGMEAQIDCSALAEKAPRIFTKLSACFCGRMSGPEGDYLLFRASADAALTPEEEAGLENWLAEESGLDQVRLEVEAPAPAGPEAEPGAEGEPGAAPDMEDPAA